MSKLGSDLLTVPQDILQTTANITGSAPGAPLGSRASNPDGRVYRYAQVGTTSLIAGNLLQGVAATANHQNLTPLAIAGTGTYSVVVTLGATAATSGQYTNGYLVINSGSGHLGYTYSIQSNTAAASSGTPTIYLAEPLINAIVTTDAVSLVPNEYSSVIQAPTALTGPIVGVAVTAASASYYCWVQTRGPAAVLSDASVAAQGGTVMPSVTTAGSVTATVGTGYAIGNAIVAGVSAQTRPVFLTLE